MARKFNVKPARIRSCVWLNWVLVEWNVSGPREFSMLKGGVLKSGVGRWDFIIAANIPHMVVKEEKSKI